MAIFWLSRLLFLFVFLDEHASIFLRRKEMSIPGSGKRKPVVVLTYLLSVSFDSPLGFSYCRSFALLFILVRPSFVFHSPEFPTVFSPFSLLLFLTLSLPLCFCPPWFGSSSGFVARGRRRFLVTAGVHHGGEEHQPRDAPTLDCSSNASPVSLLLAVFTFEEDHEQCA